MTELILIVFGTILASSAHLILRDHTDEKRRAVKCEFMLQR
jgi:hypothetical protein